MRRILVVLALVLVAAGANAQLRVSDVLLTENGTLFTIDPVNVASFEQEAGISLDTSSTTVLRLMVQDGEESETIIVPGSLSGGNHFDPSIAWNEVENRLYVFWQRMPGVGASELLFASYKDGEWSSVETFDGGSWRVRFNLKVTITRLAERRLEDGSTESRPALIAHAIWWEQFGDEESARYAMLDLAQDDVRSVQVHDLSEFVTESNPEPYTLPEGYDRSVFRTPFAFPSPEGDSVDVLFANWSTNRYQLVTIRPVEDEANGILHIPTGVTSGEFNPSPIRVRNQSEGLKALRTSGANGTILFFSNNGDSIDYSEFRKGTWSDSKALRIDEVTTLDTVLEGLRRRVSQR